MSNRKSKRIIFTGGGSAGHVTPNLALITKLHKENWDVFYIGSQHGLEKDLITKITPKIPYYSIPTGKLRRYFSLQNFADPFKIVVGMLKAGFLCHKIKPQIVFSKGGFVAFPVVVAAWLLHIPVIVHESDFSPGLANRLCFPFARKICISFAQTESYIPAKHKSKLVVSGSPIREELFNGDKELGRKICDFSTDKKTILVQGGSLGAAPINKIIHELLPKLLPDFNVAHSVGKNNIDTSLSNIPGYRQFEYLDAELPHVLSLADFVISRAGANSVHELIALKKPHILLPLSREGSRGDQLLNAKYYADLGVSYVIFPENLTAEVLMREIYKLSDNLALVTKAFKNLQYPDGVAIIYTLIQAAVGIESDR